VSRADTESEPQLATNQAQAVTADHQVGESAAVLAIVQGAALRAAPLARACGP
jgi:hypothetical protein